MLFGIQVAAQQQVMRHAGKAAYATVAGIEGRFDGGQGEGTAIGDLQSPLPGFCLKVGGGHDAVDQTPIHRLLRGDLGVGVPDFLGALLPDEVLQVPGTVACVEASDHGANLSEHGGVSCNGDVTNHLQHVPAAHCHAVDGGNDRLLEPVDGFVHLQRGEDPGVELRIFHAFLAATEAEESVSGAGQDNDARARFATDFVDAVTDFVAHGQGEHVAVGGAVQGDGAYRAVFLIGDFLKAQSLFSLRYSKLLAEIASGEFQCRTQNVRGPSLELMFCRTVAKMTGSHIRNYIC